MLSLHNLAYTHPDKTVLLSNISLTLNSREKVALVGNNGSGKSTLLRIIAGELSPTAGQVKADASVYLVPQVVGQFDHLSVGAALGVEHKLDALHQILSGTATDLHFSVLNDDWAIEDRCAEALSFWNLRELSLDQPLSSLSGGQKTRVFLAGIHIHKAELILLDEPTNHLDTDARQLLSGFVQKSSATMLVVSHDREFLNLLNKVAELHTRGISVYGGNYDFYTRQKGLEIQAISQGIKNAEKALKSAREREREAMDRQNKLDARGKKKQEKAGVARIMMNTLKNNAENSTSKIKGVHAEKISGIQQEAQDLRLALPDIDKMKFNFQPSELHRGKLLFSARKINFSYGSEPLWSRDLGVELRSGDRIRIEGANGSGKSSLIKIISGELQVLKGEMRRQDFHPVYIDQDYTLIRSQNSIYEQAQSFNNSALSEHEIKIRLSRFLFGRESWDKSCSSLSGGERMRLALCCLTISSPPPDLLILDEPTNNLDIQNTDILIAAVREYSGTLLLVSHDEYFCRQVMINGSILLA